MMCKRNSDNVPRAVLNGNFNPYSNCEHGWFESVRFHNRIYYQSSYERKFLEFCESFPKITSLQRVVFMIPYIDKSGKIRNYLPDFIINGNVVIEIKPESMLHYNNNEQKIKAGGEVLFRKWI